MGDDRYEITDDGDALRITEPGGFVFHLHTDCASYEEELFIAAIRQQSRDLAELRAELAAITAERDEARQLYAKIADDRDMAEARLAAIDATPVVAWLCAPKDGSRTDATTREETRDDYARFGRAIQELIARPAKDSP